MIEYVADSYLIIGERSLRYSGELLPTEYRFLPKVVTPDIVIVNRTQRACCLAFKTRVD